MRNFEEICCTNLATSLITIGMKKQKALHELTADEAKLIEGLRQRPDMMERMQSILKIARNENGPLKTADEVEGLLIEEMRRLFEERGLTYEVVCEQTGRYKSSSNFIVRGVLRSDQRFKEV